MNLRTRIERLEQMGGPPGVMGIEVSVGGELAPIGHVGGQHYDQAANETPEEFKARLRAAAVEKGVAYFVVGGLGPPRQCLGDVEL